MKLVALAYGRLVWRGLNNGAHRLAYGVAGDMLTSTASSNEATTP